MISNGVKVSLVDLGLELPKALDSDLDNGIITHELFHGVTDRMVGGASSYCLDNAESMSEGWSDFFALALTAKAADRGDQPRGFAYYLLKDEETGKGYRRYPYSTDMLVLPVTYGDVSSTQETHDVGQVWAAMIWDMYWALVDEYGWNADPFQPTSGNYRAIKLVMEGLKNLPCSPGFVDGRDAILAADQSLYDGADVCTIWKVFARRGLGYSADEGSPFDAGDQKEAFDLPPVCTNKILVSKTVTDFIHPGDEIKVTVQVGNYKNEAVSNVKVNDEIPEGTTYKLNSSNIPATIQGNSISFELGNMLPRDNQTITYTLLSNPDTWSKRIFKDEVDDQSNNKWLAYTLGDAASNVWQLHSDLGAHSGNWVWNTSEVPEISKQVLELNPDNYVFHVDVDHPVLRFYHQMDTQGGINGGVVDVKEVGATNWEPIDQDILRHGYTTKMDYRTFFTPHISAFSGSDSAFQATYVDLRHWAGKDVQVRFRFGTYLNDHGGEGWSIDDIEFMDMISYNSEVCVMSDQGDMECASAPEVGTIVESREPVTSTVEQATNLPVAIFPNPANDHITIQWNDNADEDVNVMLESMYVKILSAHTFHLDRREQATIPVDNVPAGFYVVKISTKQAQSVVKVIIQ